MLGGRKASVWARICFTGSKNCTEEDVRYRTGAIPNFVRKCRRHTLLSCTSGFLIKCSLIRVSMSIQNIAEHFSKRDFVPTVNGIHNQINPVYRKQIWLRMCRRRQITKGYSRKGAIMQKCGIFLNYLNWYNLTRFKSTKSWFPSMLFETSSIDNESLDKFCI